ncbi:MBG domain-containing protein [Flavobacterium granuli]|uniref:Fibronectin type-III domain-containing protein n=1 Tax=Flavobacterium granuli TaxID=280093 RepID=A0A1M5RRE8_9FLAO|nr:MBG domain-containing protein [Flavobacterium granuli]PRZ22782.1 hypothetical protein BC624_10630 [Flavobacterium granuli]SHH28678.1 hypothetical protein SAMN05443373_11092 [Flavobacterium granuli]
MKQNYSNFPFFINQFRVLFKSKLNLLTNRKLSINLIFLFCLLSLQLKAQTYCTPAISNTGVYINSLQFNYGTPSQSYISNGNSGYTATLGSSSGNLNQYHYSSFFHSINNSTGSAKQVNLKGYADWNNDGDFDDLLEIFLNYNTSVPPNSSSTTGGGIVPELAAIPGNIRIRFVLKGGTDTATACGTAEEVEDYYMVVQANVAPVLNTSLTNTLSSIKSTDTNNEGFYINELVDMNEPTAHLITDADDRNTTFQTAVPRGIAIYNQTAINGTWQYKVGSGSWANFGSVSASNALHLLADASLTPYQNKTKIRFVPTGVGTPTFDFRAWDGTNGLNYNGTFHVISTTGGTTAYSTTTTSANLPVLLGSDFDGTKMYLVNDHADQQLFSADINRTTGTVTQPNTLLSGSDTYKGFDIAIDETNGKIYWSNADYSNVSYCNLDGTGVGTIANADESGLTGVAVGGNKLYYSGYSGIQVSNLDGSSKAAVSFDMLDLCDIGDIEYDNGKLYFVYNTCSDSKYKVIQCNTDGTGLTVLYTTSNYIKGLNVVNGTAYWTENKSSTNEGYLYKKAVSLGSGGSATLVLNEQKTGYNDVFVDSSNSFIYVLDYDPVFSSGHTGLKRMSLTGTGITRLGYYKMNVYSLVFNNSVLSNSPALSTTSLTGFDNVCLNTTSAPNSFTISGTDLTTANITVGALSGYTYSTTAGGTYTSTLNLVQSGGSYSQPIYVKFTPTAVQTYNGNITIGGGGATSTNVATTGSGIACVSTVTTLTVLNITPSGATFSGEVSADGGAAVTERGFVYATSTNPTTSNTKVQDGTGTGAFSEVITGLNASTTYYVRAYAINSVGTSYGNEESFTTSSPPCAGTITIGTIASGAGYAINNGVLTTAGDATVPASVILDYLQNTGNLILQSCNGNIVLATNISGALSTERTLTLKATGNIMFNTGSSIVVSGKALNTVLWSDSDKDKAGAIYLKQSAITTNGGHLWIGGGTQSATPWNGLTVGDGSAYASAIHTFTIGANTNNYKNGITFFKSSVNTDAGNLAVSGIADGVSGVSNGYNGVYMEQSSLVSGSGNIDLKAISTATNNDGSWHYGLLMGTVEDNTTATIASTSGKITILGETDFSEQTYGAGVGLYSFGNANSTVMIKNVSGAIDIKGRLKSTGFNNQYGGIFLFGGGQEQIVSQTGTINLEGTSANSNVAGINQWPGNTNSAIGFDGINPFSGDITFNSNTFINYAGVITANNLELLGSGVVYDFSNSGNNINSLTADTGTIKYLDSNALTLEDINATGEIEIATNEGNLTLAGNLTTTSSSLNAIILNAGKSKNIGVKTGGDILVSGTPIITTGSSGIAKLFSGSEAGSTGLTDLVGDASNTRMVVDETTTTFNPVLVAGNTYALYRVQTKINLTVNSQNLAKSKTYNGTNLASVSNIDLLGIQSGDDVTVTGEATYDNKIAGTSKTITVVYTIGGTDASKYTAPESLVVNDGIILKKELNVSGLIAVDKVYDATKIATVSGTVNLTGIENGDIASLNGTPTYTFADANVGTGISITTAGYMLSGTDAVNYTILQPTFTANVTARTLTVTATATDKTYDGSTMATVALSDDRVNGDILSVSNTTATFNNKNVGVDKTVSIFGITISGADAANYTVNTTATTTADILAKPITVTATASQNKVYGVVDPVFAYSVSPSLVGSDSFTGTLTRNTGENVGTYAITEGSLSAGSNYTISYVSKDFTITAQPITVKATASQTKVYGTTDPIFTYSVSPSLVGSDTFSGALTRATGENIGTYAITQGSLSAGSNYTISYVSKDFTITAQPITVTATASQTKVYGTTDPIFTYSVSPSLVGSDTFSGALTRATGENIGTYAITQGSLSAGSNYTISYVSKDFTIIAKPITVMATAFQTKVYGTTDPTFTYTVSPSLVGSDTFSGALTRATGENIGTYAITQGSLSAGSNYTISYVSKDFTIIAKPITVTATASQTKVYGIVNPVYSYSVSPSLVGSDSFTGVLTRNAGENIGTYAITEGSLSAGSNYTISYVSNDFTITAKPITVTATASQNKVYGVVDPVFAYSVSPSLVGSDTFSGALTRATGENIGTYAITQGSLSAGSNYTISYVSKDFTITAKPITVTATASQSKVYGVVDPVYIYSVSPSLVGSDTFSGALTRATGENIGTYAITQGSLSAGSNYTISYVSKDFTITAQPITVTATASQTKVYGTTDPIFTYSVSPSLVGSDSFTGTLTRNAGENIGTYAITEGSLSAGSNYTISYVSKDFTITAKPITVTATASQTKVYGTTDPIFAYTVSPSLVGVDLFTGMLSRNAGENVGTYAITLGSLSAGSNYTISYVSKDFGITAKPITVSANFSQTKVYGTIDPIFSYSVSPSLVNGDVFTGSLIRTVGNDVGVYAINQGTLSAGLNYTITYVGTDFSITKADQLITWNQAITLGCDGQNSVLLNATSNSGLVVNYTSSNSDVVAVVNGSVISKDYGSASITASQTGNNNYNAAPLVVLPVVNSQPNLIRKQFEDIIFFDNSSKSFKSYTWYKNGVLVPSQTNQYFKESGALNGTYYAVATKLDGTLITSCPLILSPTVEEEYIKIVPNPVKPDATYELLTNVSSSRLQNAHVEVFNMIGVLMENKITSQNSVTLKAPTVEGIYIVRMTLANGKIFTKNLLVKN